MAVGPSQLHVMPHTAITIISTNRCLRLRVCRGSESDSKYDPIDSTFTHLVAIRYILAGPGSFAAQPSVAKSCEHCSSQRCTISRAKAPAPPDLLSMRAGPGWL